MEIDRQLIVDYLNNRGNHDKAVRAGTELPPIVDTDRESGLLGELDVQPEDLAGGHPPGPAGQGVVRDMDALDVQPEDLAGGHPPGPAGLGVVGDPDD